MSKINNPSKDQELTTNKGVYDYSDWSNQALSLRGVPPTISDLSKEKLQQLNWYPHKGDIPLPMLTLNQAIYESNRDSYFALLSDYGAYVAPHAKTPMSPLIAQDLIDHGAWGLSVANLQQASLFMKAGFEKIILANPIGSIRNCLWLKSLLQIYPNVEIYCFVDSLAYLNNLEAAYSTQPINILIEVGTNRTGIRNIGEVCKVIDAVMISDKLQLAGVATYEGAVVGENKEMYAENMQNLLNLTEQTYYKIRAQSGNRKLILTAGGSLHFDRILHHFKALNDEDKDCELVLRSGALFFSDHGIYQRGFVELDNRALLKATHPKFSAHQAFKPSMSVWAEIISCNDKGMVICAMGMRDISYDLDFAIPINIFRDGKRLFSLYDDSLDEQSFKISKLNDQHTFLKIPIDVTLEVGDIIEFGISHPCTCFDKWRHFYGLDINGKICQQYLTYFG